MLAAAALSACDNGAQPTATLTPELTATQVLTATLTPELTATQVLTATLTPELTATQALTATLTPELTATQAPTATLTPELTATPTSTLTPTPTPTVAAPSPPVDGGSRSAADYTEAEIAEIAAALNREILDAINSHPKPDLARAKATYSTACQPDDEVEFAAQVDGLLDLFRTGELSVDVVAATRLPGHDDAAIVLAFPLLDDERTSGATRSLIVFENGRWLDSDCEEGMAMFLGSEPDDADRDGDSDGSEDTDQETPTPTHRPIVLGDNPADHTDEEIARSVEWVGNDSWEAALEEPEPNIDRMRAISATECQIETDEELIEAADATRQQLEDLDATRIWIEVQGIERVDDSRAWFVGTIYFDDFSFELGAPSLVIFEDGQWRDGECLIESDPALQRPTEIEPDQRVSYIGEPIRLQYDWEEQPYELTVLGAPEVMDDMTVRLPVRIMAITDTLDLTYVTYSGWLKTEADAEGNVIEWSADPCEEGVFEHLTLVKGDSHETLLCFGGTGYDQERTVPDRPFIRFTSDHGDTLRTVELMHSISE